MVLDLNSLRKDDDGVEIEVGDFEIDDVEATENYVWIRKMQMSSVRGIALPNGVVEDSLAIGIVVKVGPGTTNPKTGQWHDPNCEVGDIVFIPFALMPVPVFVGRHDYYICRDSIICGKMKPAA